MTESDALDTYGKLDAFVYRKLMLPWHVLRWHWQRHFDEVEADGQRTARHVLSELRRLYRECPCADCIAAGFHGLQLPTMKYTERARDFEGDF